MVNEILPWKFREVEFLGLGLGGLVVQLVLAGTYLVALWLGLALEIRSVLRMNQLDQRF